MIAQVYKDEPYMVRIFNRDGKNIADLPLDDCSTEEADTALNRIKMRRRLSWIATDWGYETQVRF